MSTSQVFKLPDLGEGLIEAELVRWCVSPGEEIEPDQAVAEVETAKAAVEVPCPHGGVVTELHGQPGDVIAVGAPLITVAVSSPQEEQYREEERAGSGNVLVGYGTGHTAPRRSRRRPRRVEQVSERSGPPRVISPIVRKLAQQHGIDLAGLSGSGPGGLILRKDVEAAMRRTDSTGPVQDGEKRTPLRGLRATVASKLSRSRREIPDASTWVDVDATRLVEAREVLRERGVGMLGLIARICVAGLHRFPELNSTVDVERNEVVQYDRINLGFAAQTQRGLLVPVVSDAGRKNTAELSAEMAELTERARAGKLGPEELTGGTFTLNNYGVFGVDGSTPIINYPEAAILGIGRITDKPWAHRGELALRKVTQLSLTFDHRVCDGGTAGGFLRYVADCLEDPVRLLAEV
ncbi:dihydrolipoamide acetyltransferase family protein [Saccharopolyspora rectivirgula]|jgi:2-oxoisovalerate dehydrogenase E2 component (dihydrolipoyl transacylase)|uniref:Dihydrolipoamide acetyltransferase component of pyruvate dehydrogenase complex n=1 Tax=Saccharopolyspora rectivirgula TaxID=28042 RepID=A0A073B171_9PSEU|nr:dihydrolipoamide acetyltransferase family protein [Saccharopolyspora rectivirgula]KEI45032.1 branched-chain alpha-keto acid dehydrogenase subunit E2 [Saccharopolyspora rectivirgula]